MNKTEILDSVITLIILIFMAVTLIGFKIMNDHQKELMNQVIELKNQNEDITKQVDKLNKTIDSINAKRLKEVADKNNVGG